MNANFAKLNDLIKDAMQKDCYIVGDSNSSYRIEFPSTLTVDEFTKFADDCKDFLSQYDIETGSIVAFTPDEGNKIFRIQISVPPVEKFPEKLDALNKAIQLHEVANKGNVESVKRLLDEGADVNSKNIAGETSVQVADRMGHNEVIDILLDHGADISKSNRVKAVLYSLNRAVKEGEALVKLLTDTPVNTAVAEGATGGAEGMQGSQKLKNIIRFFSPATRIQAANSTEADEQQAEVQPTAANLGK